MAIASVPYSSLDEGPPVVHRDANSPVIPDVDLFRRELVHCYHQLVDVLHARSIRVDLFCRYFLANRDDEGRRSGSELQVPFLTALLETFKVGTVAGISYLRLRTLSETNRSEAAGRRPRRRDAQRARNPAMYRCRIGRLTFASDITIRVTECMREQNQQGATFIKINFHRKKDEEKLTHIITQLNRAGAGLGGPIRARKGLICAAPYLEEMGEGESHENYARAIVLRDPKEQNHEVEVRFLDFGFVDHVDKTSLRKLPEEFLKTPALSYTGLVVNTNTVDPRERESEAFRMMDAEQTVVRVLKYNKEKKLYEMYVYGL